MVFLPAGAPENAIATFTEAFAAIQERDDFAEISTARLGVYPQLTGAADVPQEAKDFVIIWLSERYGVVLQ